LSYSFKNFHDDVLLTKPYFTICAGWRWLLRWFDGCRCVPIQVDSCKLSAALCSFSARNVAKAGGLSYSDGVVTAPSKDYGQKIYEGKAKIGFKAPGGSLVHYFKDSATAFNPQKKAEFGGKGALNLKMSTSIFGHLKQHGLPTHFLRQIDDRAFETKELKMLPVEVVVRNRMAGSLARRLGESEGAPIQPAVVEWYLKNDQKGDPQVSEDLLVSNFGQQPQDLKECRPQALQVNEILFSVRPSGSKPG
jgi:phosphoribosylaminoimidazole-succinocarboxamide synthase